MEKIRFGTTLYTGENSLKRLEEFDNERILIVTDQFISQSKILETVMNHFSSSVETMMFSEVVPDPPIETIVSGLEKTKEYHPTMLLALGGGSAIDAAKAILYFGLQSGIFEKMPFIVIPTTSGTGSEVTNFSIITDAEKMVKYPLISDDILPTEAILDVSMVTGLPPVQTADTGIDVLTHALEAYVSIEANEVSDMLAEKAIVNIFDYLERAYHDGKDKEAREKMHIASCIAGMAFNLSSLGISHGIAHAAGARFHIAHGRLNGILLPHVIRYNSGMTEKKSNVFNETAKKYTKIAKLLGLSAGSPQMGIRSLTNAITSLEKRLNMPTSFSAWGIDRATFEEHKQKISEDALKDRCTMTNPIKPTVKDALFILEKAF